MAAMVETAKNPSAAKFDKVILRQLEQTSGRVRRLDWLNTLLVVVTACLGYAALLLSLDQWLDLPSGVRLGSFAAFALGLLGYLVVQVHHLFFLRVNPYYAARQLEKTVNGAKDSIINLLDLHDEPLPAAIRNSLSIKAAQDLKHADLDRAVATTSPYLLVAVMSVAFIALLLLFVAGPGQFTSLLARSFLPFEEIALVPKTALTLLEPNGGDATVGENQSVHFRVRVDGRVPALNQPDSLYLLYRYGKSDKYQKRPLDLEQEGDWSTTLASDQIPSPGIFYKIAGGDAETPEYFLRVTSAPAVTKFIVTYNPRPYRPWAKQLKDATSPYLEEYEGTEVGLEIIANRDLHSAYLEIVYQDQDRIKLDGKKIADNPRAMTFQFPLLKSGKFTVHFKSKQGEENSHAPEYQIVVAKDLAPKVQLDEPAADTIQLPVNGVLKLKGTAEDFDVQHLKPSAGIKQLSVQMKVVKGQPETMLQPKHYRDGKSFELAEHHYPKFLEYQDFVDLAQLKQQGGLPFQAKDGMEIEYWLEAVDICDYPDKNGHVAKSQVRKLIIVAVEDQKKADEQKLQAQKDQKDHDKKQDDSLNQQSKEIQKKDAPSAGGAGDESEDKKKNDANNKGAAALDKIDQELNKQAEQNPGKSKDNGSGNKDSGSEPKPMNQPPDTKPSGDKKGDGSDSGKDKGKDQGKAPDAGKGTGSKDQPQPGAKGGDQKDSEKATGDKSGQKQPPTPDSDKKPGGAKDKQGGGTPVTSPPKGSAPMPDMEPAQAKGDPDAGKPSQGDPAPMPGKLDDAKKGTAKGGPGAPPKTNDQPETKNLTPEQVQDLAKKMKDAGLDPKLQDDFQKAAEKAVKDYKQIDPSLKEKVKNELEQIGKNAKDPETKQAAKDALDGLKKTEAGDQKPNSPGTPDNPMDPMKTGDPGKKGVGNDPSDNPNPGHKPKTDKAGDVNTPQPDPNNSGSFAGKGKPENANKEFLEKLSTLQLEQLKDKIAEYKKLLADAALQKKLNLNPEQLKNAADYLKTLEDKVNNNEPIVPPGSIAGQFGSTAPSEIGVSSGKHPQTSINIALPPLEYQQAFKNLTIEPLPKQTPAQK